MWVIGETKPQRLRPGCAMLWTSEALPLVHVLHTRLCRRLSDEHTVNARVVASSAWTSFTGRQAQDRKEDGLEPGGPSPHQDVSSTTVYNVLQHLPALSLVIDVRSSDAYVESHVDAATNVPLGKISNPALLERVSQAFSHINMQTSVVHDFNLCVCSQKEDPGVEAIIQSFERAAHRLEHFRVSRVLLFSYVEFHQRFPYVCSDWQNFEASRLFPASVADRVFLSNWGQASDATVVLGALRATHVVNCTPAHACCFEGDGVRYFRVPIVDDQQADLLSHLEPAVSFITEALASGGVVLAHCKHGHSRSASVLAAWLMKSQGWSLECSLAHLKGCRPGVGPNRGFLQQLNDFETQIRDAT